MTRTIAVIPARGGSKGVPLKNLEPVAGRPLVARAVDACLRSGEVDLVVVSTDHDAIAAVAENAGARVVRRPADISGDQATSESAVMHALDTLAAEGVEPAVTLLVQCTSPFIDAEAMADAVRRVRDGDEDSVLAAAPTHVFTWRLQDGAAVAVGHDASFRPRRQDREPLYRETGAFYVMRTAGLREHNHRFFGRIGIAMTPEETAMEIDTPADLDLARALAPEDDGAVDVDAVVTDFDGVHTDDHAWVDAEGREMVAVHRGDGLGVSRLRRAGIRLLILSTETNPVVAARASKLGVPCHQGVEDKAADLLAWIQEAGLDPARVAYLGNDVNDLPAMKRVGWPIAVADARSEVRALARMTLSHAGGHGAVRELADRVLSSRSAGG